MVRFVARAAVVAAVSLLIAGCEINTPGVTTAPAPAPSTVYVTPSAPAPNTVVVRPAT